MIAFGCPSVRPSVAVSVRSGVDSVEVCVNQLRAASFTYFAEVLSRLSMERVLEEEEEEETLFDPKSANVQCITLS